MKSLQKYINENKRIDDKKAKQIMNKYKNDNLALLIFNMVNTGLLDSEYLDEKDKIFVVSKENFNSFWEQKDIDKINEILDKLTKDGVKFKYNATKEGLHTSPKYSDPNMYTHEKGKNKHIDITKL